MIESKSVQARCSPPPNHAIAKTVQQACLDAALQAYEDAGLSGLCAAGRWEFAVQAIRGLDLVAVLEQAHTEPGEIMRSA